MAGIFENVLIYGEALNAGADLSAFQYGFVKISNGTYIKCTADTDVADGVLLNEPESGQQCKVAVLGDVPVLCAAAVAIGILVGPDANSKGEAKTPGTHTTKYVHGKVFQATASTNQYAMVHLNCLNPHRAA